MAVQRASLDEIRGFYAKLMAAASGSRDPRLERIFELVPREAFRLTAQQAPDATATAVYPEIWFSSEPTSPT